MGLDMRPMGKPKPGFEKRFLEIFDLLAKNELPNPSFFQRILGKKQPTKDELLDEWFSIQIPAHETVKAPRVGRDVAANEWAENKYKETDRKISLEKFLEECDGYYVGELATEPDGVPVYITMYHDENAFRGQFLQDCIEMIGEDLVNEAWETKLAEETLDYGNRLMNAADTVATKLNLEYIKLQRMPPDLDKDADESKLHIVYSLAKWLIFYGKNGHGYEADY